MPRSASSPFNYSVPSGTAAVSGQVISSVAYNNFLSDITNNGFNAAWPVPYGGTGTTDGSSLVPNGSAATPAIRFQNETNSGWFRVGAGDIGLSILGTQYFDFQAAGQTNTSSAASYTAYKAVSTDAGAAAGPIVEAYRNSASPAVNDVVGQVSFTGQSSTGVKRTYGSIGPVIVSPTNAAESSQMQMSVLVAGTPTTVTPISVVRTQVFTSSGTYTPNANMIYCEITCLGGGGGGGGTAATGTSLFTSGAGGGAGSLSTLVASIATIGASKTVTIGAAGTAGTAGNNAGGAGGDTSVGTLCIGKGGSGGQGSDGTSSRPIGGAGGVAGTGDVTGTGQSGCNGILSGNTSSAGLSNGGSSSLGGGGLCAAASGTGGAATGFGGGGAGGQDVNSTSSRAGGAGTKGIVKIVEYCAA